MAKLTTFDFNRAVLIVQGVVVQVHHAGERRREAHAVGDAAVAIQSDQFVAFCDIV